MSASSSRISTNQKVDSVQTTSTNKQSIPQPSINTQSSITHSNHHTQIPSHLQLQQQQQQQQKLHGIPSIISQSQKQHLRQPPSYHPPPPPGSILKNISPQRSGIPTLNYQNPSTHQTADTNAHLNLKFPQEVPKLTNIYIPDRTANPSRIATARTLQQQRQNTIVQQSSPHPSTTDEEQTINRNTQQQQEMLKFVRKSDSDSMSNHSPNPNVNVPSSNSNLIRMASNEQNRHFQVK